MHMRHSCRCALHPVLTLAAVSVVGSLIGFGLHVWFEPWTSAIVVAVGSLAGLALSSALGESLLVGLAVGAGLTAFALGARALASIMGTLNRASSLASTRVWFSR
jgi:tetrahydromethanopterin S-methyltransferase subunit E